MSGRYNDSYSHREESASARRQGEADCFGAEGPTAPPRSGHGGGYPGYTSDAKRQHQVTKGDAARFPERSQPRSGYDRDRHDLRSHSGGRECDRSRERSNVYNPDCEHPRSVECRRSPDRSAHDRSRHAPQTGAQAWQYDPAVHGAPDPLSPARGQDPVKHIAWLQQSVQWYRYEARTVNQECRRLQDLLTDLQFQLRRKQEVVDELQSKVNPLERQLQLKTAECALLQSASSLQQQQLRAKSAEGEPPQSAPQHAQQQETPKPSLLASGRLAFSPRAEEPEGPDGGEAVTAQEEEFDVECVCGCDPCSCFDAAPSDGSNGAEAGELSGSQPVSERSSPKPLAAEQQLPPPPQQPNSKGGSSDFRVLIGNGPHLTPSDLEATTQSHASSGPEYVKAPAPASYSTAFEQPALIRSPHAYFDGPWRQISVEFCDDLLPFDRLPECHIGCLVHGFWARHYSWQCDDIRGLRNSYVEFRRSRLLVKQRQRELQG